MRRDDYDPLDVIPSADIVQERLISTERLARRLRLLLDLARRIEATEPRDKHAAPAAGKGGVHAN